MGQHDSSRSNILYPAWQNEYQDAVLELDPEKLLDRVYRAEAAISKRAQELAQSSDNPDHKAEQQAIADALAALRVLKRDKLHFPDWEKK